MYTQGLNIAEYLIFKFDFLKLLNFLNVMKTGRDPPLECKKCYNFPRLP